MGVGGPRADIKIGVFLGLRMPRDDGEWGAGVYRVSLAKASLFFLFRH